MNDSVTQLKEYMDTFLLEHTKFNEKGNKAAGTRARKALMDIQNLTKTIRVEIQAQKNA